MQLIEFSEQSAVFAEDQPEYLPLPAWIAPGDPQGRIVCCWQLSWKERLQLLLSGCMWHSVLTFNRPLQPQMLSVDKPVML